MLGFRPCTTKGVSLLNRWDKLGAHTDGVDVQGDLSRCALDIIGSIAFGIEMDATNAPESKWATAADIILKETALQTMQPVGNQDNLAACQECRSRGH